jgi:hypothetical protein
MEPHSERRWPIFVALIFISIALGYYLGLGRGSQSVNRDEMVATSTPDIQSTTDPVNNMLLIQGGEFGDEQIPLSKPVQLTISVKGKYLYSEDPRSQVSGKVCFEQSVVASGTRALFCFDNADEAAAIFGIQKGFSDGGDRCTVAASAQIEIKDYTKFTADLGGYDRATLTNVISVGNPSFVPCSK